MRHVYVSSTPQLQPLLTTGLWVATSVKPTPNPGRCLSTLATISVAAPSSTTSGSSLLLTAGKSLYHIKFSDAFVCMFMTSLHNHNNFLPCLNLSPYSQIAVLGDNHIWMHEGTEQYMSVDAIYWHQSYDYQTLDYDIMLMKLAHPVTVNQYVKPVALPKACASPGDMCTVSGWGNIYTDSGELLYPSHDNRIFIQL